MNESKLIEVFKDSQRLLKYYRKTVLKYQPYTPAQYLYFKIIGFKKQELYLDSFIELCYATLCAWNMNQRAAKLAKYEDFKSSLLANYSEIQKLQLVSLREASEEDFSDLKTIFNSISIVAKGKSKLVATSKCLHFFLPNLVLPIDRKYTIAFFKTTVPKDREKQAEKFIEIQKAAQSFVKEVSLVTLLDLEWNRNIPKLIDNLIICQKPPK